MKKLNLDVDVLKKFYYGQRIPPKKIGFILGCSECAVRNEMKRQSFIFYPKGELHPRLFGCRNPAWKGGRYKDGNGYIRKRVGTKKYKLEHILVWEQTYKKKLPRGWAVHHLNGIRDDNRALNLFALSRAKHSRLLEAYKKRIRQLEKELKNNGRTLPLPLE